jgi:hypothetical protein
MMKTICKKDSSTVNGGIEDLLRHSRVVPALRTKFNRDLVELEKEFAEGDSKELQSS